ncbi:MAG: GTP-binding protein [Candidatus Lokiarchaeota archaeon]|nr:GTP-binding protein [Candidatus Lokiarchaeota archaeon]
MSSSTFKSNGVRDSKQKQGKICFVGAPAVGKTTLMKMLSQKMINKQYFPTQGFDLGSVSFNGFKLSMWDFGGQKAYLKHYLSQYIHGADLVFIVTDSTPKNVLTTKELVQHAQGLLPQDACRIIALANKQDLKGHMDPKRIKNILDIPTIGICAIEPEYRDELINAIGWCMEEIEKEKMNE